MASHNRPPEQRLDELWSEHAPAVVRHARRRVLPAEVDEVVAETFVVAWRRLDDVPVVALPWLLGVARAVSANVRRTARRRDALTDRLAAQVPEHDRNVTRSTVYRAIRRAGAEPVAAAGHTGTATAQPHRSPPSRRPRDTAAAGNLTRRWRVY